MAKLVGTAPVLALVTLVIAASASARPLETSALAVQVMKRAADDVQCVRAPCTVPAPGVRVTILREGTVLARRTTDKTGRFRIELTPGTYLLRAPNLLSLPKRGERKVIVRAGQTTRVTLTLAPPLQTKPGYGNPA
ncbi:MAG: carboxypeptidase-like regulatory domain-containing protein [Gaiella sp.]